MWAGIHMYILGDGETNISNSAADSDVDTDPFTRILSLTSIRCGEVNSPVRKPDSLKMASENVQVEP